MAGRFSALPYPVVPESQRDESYKTGFEGNSASAIEGASGSRGAASEMGGEDEGASEGYT